jgi:hypothetical protein
MIWNTPPRCSWHSKSNNRRALFFEHHSCLSPLYDATTHDDEQQIAEQQIAEQQIAEQIVV